MIRCVRMWTGEDGDSLFEDGWIDLAEGTRGDSVGQAVPVVELSFQETRSGGSYEWHQDPVPRFVITLSGTLEFTTKSGATFTIHPGDVLLAQDNSGTGHQWRLIELDNPDFAGIARATGLYGVHVEKSVGWIPTRSTTRTWSLTSPSSSRTAVC